MSIMVAGIGNVFLGDDAFGVEVVRRLRDSPLMEGLPAEVDVVDYGIRGVHLAYDLIEGRYRDLVLVDAVELGAHAGTVAVLEAGAAATGRAATLDAHSMSPAVVLNALEGLGGRVDRVLVVGCQPESVEERMGLSGAVDAAVGPAEQAVSDVVHRLAQPLGRDPAARASRGGEATWTPSTC